MPRRRVGLVVLLSLCLAGSATAERWAGRARDAAAVERLAAETRTRPAIADATGTVRLVRLAPEAAAPERRPAGPATRREQERRALAFLGRHGRAFGIAAPERDLALVSATVDTRGFTHLSYAQRHAGVRVFGALVKVHFDPDGALATVNGTLVPDLAVGPTPTLDAAAAGRIALAAVGAPRAGLAPTVRDSELLVFREGLAKGVPGENHLAWQVEVGNGADVREFVYVDAHTGKVVDQITGIHDALDRRVYDAEGDAAPGPNYPASPFWVEGQALPTGNAEADGLILASGDVWAMFWNAFGRDSFDGAGARMEGIFNRGNDCPNASWNGHVPSFCPGLTIDDVTAHEWGHAYTQYTDGLIYQWQSGALNEAYSDIWGETIDRLNGRGTDAPASARSAGACSLYTVTERAMFRVNAPAAIAGDYAARAAEFGPPLTSAGLTGDVVLADDGVLDAGTLTDGCCAGPSFVCAPGSWSNAAQVAGRIVIVDRGTCAFTVKVGNAQANGAIGVIVANNVSGLTGMSGADATITIPSLLVSRADGAAVKAQLGSGVNATLRQDVSTGTDDSYAWLLGEDRRAFRDMWNPPCYGDPGRVSETSLYACSTTDAGGVHTNSGIPNHAYALLVDGGTYNGRTVAALGLTKAAHIYYRVQSVYQVPTSDFAAHADLLELACQDLVGAPLADLLDGTPSTDVIGPADCAQVHEATLAVELRMPPPCDFQPVLAKEPPPLCAPGTIRQDLLAADFEAGAPGWTVEHTGATGDFTARDWVRTGGLPDRLGQAFFGVDPLNGTCEPGGDESGVISLTSPAITVPGDATEPLLAFDHYVATETGYDGGNLWISVNGGAWTLVAPSDWTYNAYNTQLFATDAGNTNPLAGLPAFSGTDGGSFGGSWGRSHVRLGNYAGPGDGFRLRWELGTDGCSGVLGWYVDDVTVYTCAATAVGVDAAKLVVVDRGGGRAKVVFAARDEAITKGTGTDRTAIGATLHLGYSNGTDPAGAAQFVCPVGSAKWLVNKSSVARYVNRTAPTGGGAKLALIRPGKLLKLVGRSLGDTPIDILGQGGAATGVARTAYCVDNGPESRCFCSTFSACAWSALRGGTGARLVCRRGSADPTCAALLPPA